MDYSLLRNKKKQPCSKKHVLRRSLSSSNYSTTSSSSSRSSSSFSAVSESDSTSSSSFDSSSSASTSSSSDESTSSSNVSTSSSASCITLSDSISTEFEKSVSKQFQTTSDKNNVTNSQRKSIRDESSKDLKIVFKPLKLSRSSSPKRYNNEDSTSTSKGCRIYVSHLTNKVTVEHLREIFSKYGTIKKLDLPLDVFTKMSRGFSYIEYSTPEEASIAIKHMNGGQIDGYEIICSPVQHTVLHVSSMNPDA